MAISGFSGIYQLECDVCGSDADEEFDSFYEAVEWKKDKSNLWTSRKNQGFWEDVCPECNGNADKEDI